MRNTILSCLAALGIAAAGHFVPFPSQHVGRESTFQKISVEIPRQSLATMARLATSIVRGRVVLLESAVLESGMVTTRATLAVSEWIKGTGAGLQAIESAGGEVFGRRTVVDADPRLQVGDEAFYFLWAASPDSTPGILGLRHGVFRISTGTPGVELVLGDLGDAPNTRASFAEHLRSLQRTVEMARQTEGGR